MPRANRCFLPGHVWHITHRCHNRAFLLALAVDRDLWRRWLYEARRRYGLCVLDYVVTSNHIHLLVLDRTGDGTVANSMRLVAGQTAQAYNRRRGRSGAFWEDRYHSVAVEAGGHLIRCVVYIDLNMVRAGVVDHPSQWRHGGFIEIQSPRHRYRVLDLQQLAEIACCPDVPALQAAHRGWIAASLAAKQGRREAIWTEALAVGSESFVASVKAKLGGAARHRTTRRDGELYVLREAHSRYGVTTGGRSRS